MIVTSSRIGSMRDYAAAMIGQGWTPEPPTRWAAALPGIPFPVQASRVVLKRGPARLYTLNWYVSPRSQALTLAQATLAGWWQRISGDPLWGQVNLTIGSEQDSAEAPQQLANLAGELLPAFYAVLCDYATRTLKPTRP